MFTFKSKSRSKIKTDGSRTVRRRTFFNAKKVSKKAGLLRRALLARVVGVLFGVGINEDVGAAWRGTPTLDFFDPLACGVLVDLGLQ